MALQWTLSLKDAMSSAASRASKGLDKVTSSAKTLAGVKPGAGIQKQLDGITSSANKASRALGQVKAPKGGGKSSGSFASPKTGGGGGDFAPTSAGVVAGSLAVWAGGMMGTAALGQMVYDAQNFKKSTLFAFEQITGSKRGAEEAFALANKTALHVGGDLRTNISAMNSLMAQGFSTGSADEMIRAMSDLKTINPAANLEGITRAISQIKTTGRLQGDELMQLAEAGVNVNKVYEQIGKTMGLVEGKKNKKGQAQSIGAQVRALQEAGEITDKVAIDAIMASIKTTVGGKEFGETAAAKLNGTLPGALMKAATLKEQFLSAVNVDWTPATRALDRIGQVMSGPAGQKFSEAIGNGLNRFIGLLDTVTEKDIEGYIMAAGHAFDAFSFAVTKTAGALKWFLDIGVSVSNWMQKKVGFNLFDVFMSKGPIKVIEFISGIVGTIVDFVSSIPDKLSGVGGAIGEWFAGIGETVTGWFSGVSEGSLLSGMSVGEAFANGIANGILAAEGFMIGAAKAAAQKAYDAAKSLLGIASPSKKTFEGIGKPFAQGTARGIAAGAPEVYDQSRRMGAGAFAAGQKLSSAITSSDNSRTMNIGAINAGGDGEGGGRATAREIAAELRNLNQSAA